MTKTLVLLSGGISSTTLAHHLRQKGRELYLLTIEHQQSWREIEAARDLAADIDTKFHLIASIKDLSRLIWFIRNESETGNIPALHMLMMSIATSVAERVRADTIAIGTTADALDHDSSAGFLYSMKESVSLATGSSLVLEAPYKEMRTEDVALLAKQFDVKHSATWSCVSEQDMHCGECSGCHRRRRALAAANIKDATAYKDEAAQLRAVQ